MNYISGQVGQTFFGQGVRKDCYLPSADGNRLIRDHLDCSFRFTYGEKPGLLVMPPITRAYAGRFPVKNGFPLRAGGHMTISTR